MGYVFDQIPWWIYPLFAGGGGAAAILLIPGALPFVVGIWNAMPRPVKIALLAIGTLGLAFVAGRNRGNRNAVEKQKERDAKAVERRVEVNHEVNNLDAKAADERLSRYFRD